MSPFGSLPALCSFAIAIAKMLLCGINGSVVSLFSGGLCCLSRDFMALVAHRRLSALMCVTDTSRGAFVFTKLVARETAGVISIVISSN